MKHFVPIILLFFALPGGAVAPEEVFINLNRKITPGVVSVSVTKKGAGGFLYLPPGFYLPHALPEVSGAGSGFVIDKSGVIVTNRHVIEGADKIELQFKGSEKSWKAKLLGKDKLSDIALLKVKTNFPLTALKLGDSGKLKVGQWVAAFGNPHGYAHTVTKGIISGVKREIDELNLFPLLQTDAGINRGNSGGPLVNLKGEVIGVNNAIAAGAQAISFAIPIDNVKHILKDILKYGYVRRGYIGVGLGKIPGRKGALITEVFPESPAFIGGIQRGDRVIRFGSFSVKGFGDLADAIAKTAVNTEVKVKVLRNGKAKDLKVKVRPYAPEKTAKPSSKKGIPFRLGFQVTDSSPFVLKSFKLPDIGERHPIVTYIKPRSRAARSGLKEGDLIFKVNGVKAHSVQELKKHFKAKGANELSIGRYDPLYDQYLVFSIRFP